MRRSLRVRLQVWYAAVLLAVVGGFAGFLYFRVQADRMRAIDADLLRRAEYLDSTLRRFPPRELEGSAPERPDPPERRPPPPDWNERPFRPPPGGRPAPPGSQGPPGQSPPPQGPPDEANRDRVFADLDLPGSDDPEATTWFVVWRADETVLKVSPLPPDLNGPPLPERGPRPRLEQLGSSRIVTLQGPRTTRVVVGHRMRRDHAELRAFAWQLVGSGAVVLAIGLVGGWLASGRMLKPLATISATASAISATNLSARLDPDKIDRELTELACVLNAMFARLEAAFGRQAQFTADASHELRTPLAVLRTHAELALSRPRSAEEYQQTLETCVRATGRMTGLVEGLLTLARADAGALEMRSNPVDLRQVVREGVDLLRPLIEARGLSIAVELEPVTVAGDEHRLGQVVANLVSNAIQHNRPGGQVRVRLTRSHGSAVLSVADNGKGIPEADQERLFERFFRVDKARSRSAGGNGLGLAICRSIVEAHGGTIGFTSKEGKGSTFHVRLPLEQTEP